MAQFTIQQAFDLALQHHRAGRLPEAEQLYRQILARQPRHAETYSNLGVLLEAKGRLDEAITAFRQAIALRPDYAEAYGNLGAALADRGRADQAVAACRQAIVLNPGFAEAYSNLGAALGNLGQFDEAIAACRQAIALRPNDARAHGNLGAALQCSGQLDEAIAACRQAIFLRPDFADAHKNLGEALRQAGCLDQAIAAWRQAIALNADDIKAHSSLVASLPLHPDYDAGRIAEELRRWSRQHVPLASSGQTGSGPRHSNDRNPDRRLRVGYVSPDFRNHVVGRNVLPLFCQHDHRQFEIFCYSQSPRADAMTREFQKRADGWRDISSLSDDHVEQQVREDQIDLLVDMALHTANHRLLVFARRPAPVQVTFAGYPGSTGLTAIDYRLSDPYLDPAGMEESIYSEKTIRLPDSFWCYDPLDNGDIAVNFLPALEAGFVSFGCLNNFCKINEQILSLWARVLGQTQNSRLLLLAPPGSPRQRTLDRLRQDGIDSARVQFVAQQPRRGYLEFYHRIDMGLDSFPYNGHTTSLDSFWMGVPVVTLVGQTAVSRAGWCQLSNLGLTELAGHTPEQFVRIAVELARDLPRLADLRRTLRQRMERSPLMDAPRFARSIEQTYRQMWRTWCESAQVKS